MISSTELPPLKFSSSVQKLPFKSPTAKIGWMHSETDKPGSSFDLTVKDALGRVRFERKNCKTETKQYGELINQPALVGEELSIELTNLKGTENVLLFLN